SVVGLANLGGRLAMGAALDRFFAPRVVIATWIGTIIGYVLLMQGGAGISAVVAAALFGFAMGSETDALAYIASRAFGKRHVGAVWGPLFFAWNLGAAAGPPLFLVLLKDSDLGYLGPIGIAAISIAALLLTTLRPRHFPFAVRPTTNKLD